MYYTKKEDKKMSNNYLNAIKKRVDMSSKVNAVHKIGAKIDKSNMIDLVQLYKIEYSKST